MNTVEEATRPSYMSNIIVGLVFHAVVLTFDARSNFARDSVRPSWALSDKYTTLWTSSDLFIEPVYTMRW